MRIVTLMEDTACAPEFACEHGLSFYIEANSQKLLFDMGQTDLFLRNAQALGVKLDEVDAAFVSHGHYDHGGGLAAFLKVNDHAPVYVHEKAFEPHFSRKPEGIRPIGLDAALADSGRLILPTGAYDLGPQDGVLELRVITDRCSMEIYSNGGLFNASIATVLDPSNVKVFPVFLDAGITVDFEIHRLKSMWDRA